MAQTKIEWTDRVWNPVTGCTKISPGCKHCYAERMAQRLRAMGQPNYSNGFDVTLHPQVVGAPLKWRKPQRIFVNSMSDLFHESVPFDFIAKVFGVMAATPQHTYQVFTKRPSRALTWLMWLVDKARDAGVVFPSDGIEWRILQCLRAQALRVGPCDIGTSWPLPNVWFGISAENQETLDARLPALKDMHAAVHFISFGPLLGPISVVALNGIDWVVVEGESGPNARPMDPDWARDLRDRCVARRVPFFFKQWGGVDKRSAGRLLDGRTWDQFPDPEIFC